MSMTCRLVFVVCVAVHVLVGEDLPPLSEVPNDAIILKDGKREPGTIVERRDDGTIVFTPIGRTGTIRYTRDQYDSIEPRQDASQAVLNRGRAQLKRQDLLGVRQCVRWGIEKNVPEASLTLATEALAAFPDDTDLGTLVLEQLEVLGRGGEREPVARALLERNPRFEPAYAALVAILQGRGETVELTALTDRFLAVKPTSLTANRIKAELAEASDLPGAQEAYRKLWKLHNNLDAALGYARTSLMVGNYEQALEGATALADADQHASAARALAGTALIALGRLDDGRAALQAAVADTALGEPYGAWARYNLGVVEYRLGDVVSARSRWEKDASPLGRLALAIVDKKPFTDEASLPKSQPLLGLVREHNACIALERAQADRALSGLDTKGNARHMFLSQIAQIVRTGGSEGVQFIANNDGVEALRWRAYAHILAKQWAEAEQVLGKLPEDDGYAAVYRIYVAAAQKEVGRAKDLYRKLALAANAPSDYVAVLAAEYAASEDEFILEDFDWIAGEQLGSGWQAEAIETNIRIHANDGKLVLEGTQSAAPEGVSRAWRMVAADRARGLSCTLDISAIASAQAGIEIMNEQRNVGVAYAVLADNKLGYRLRNGGSWGEWQTLPLRVEGTKPTLRVEITAGRAFAVSPDNLSQRHAMGDAILPTKGFLAVGPFGQAEPGVAWKVAAEQLEVQLKPMAKPRR